MDPTHTPLDPPRALPNATDTPPPATALLTQQLHNRTAVPANRTDLSAGPERRCLSPPAAPVARGGITLPHQRRNVTATSASLASLGELSNGGQRC